jgi:hypothetical protein
MNRALVSCRDSIVMAGFGGQELADSVERREKCCFSQASHRSFQSEALGALPALEVQFHRALQNARRCGADRASERGTADVPVHRAWPIKLGVIEDVEAFYAEQQRL